MEVNKKIIRSILKKDLIWEQQVAVWIETRIKSKRTLMMNLQLKRNIIPKMYSRWNRRNSSKVKKLKKLMAISIHIPQLKTLTYQIRKIKRMKSNLELSNSKMIGIKSSRMLQ